MNTTVFPPASNTSNSAIVKEYINITLFPAIGETGVLYVALDTESTYIWTGSQYVKYKGELLYTNNSAVPSTIGGITAGTTFSNKTMKEMWDMLLYPYINPAFTAFGITGITSTYEVGYTIPANSYTFTWAISNGINVAVNSIRIEDVTNATTLVTGIANSGSTIAAIPSISKASATSHQWRITGTNTNNTTFNRTYTVAWQWRVYYGESALSTLVEADIEALRVSALASSANGTYNMLAGGYKWICYPTAMGLKTTFKDTNTNFDVAMVAPITVNVTNQYGVTTSYYCHRTYNVLGGTISIGVS